MTQLRDMVTRLGGAWHGDDDFSFGDIDPSPFVLGTEPSNFDSAEATIVRQRLGAVPESVLAVGAMCNGDLDHVRLAQVSGELARVLGGLLFVESPTGMPAHIARTGWAILLERRSLGFYGRYAMEAEVLLRWAQQRSFRLIK